MAKITDFKLALSKRRQGSKFKNNIKYFFTTQAQQYNL